MTRISKKVRVRGTVLKTNVDLERAKLIQSCAGSETRHHPTELKSTSTPVEDDDMDVLCPGSDFSGSVNLTSAEAVVDLEAVEPRDPRVDLFGPQLGR